MSGAARMDHQSGTREGFHEQPCPARIVEVHMRENHPLDIGPRETQVVEGLQQPRHREVWTGVDKRCAPRIGDRYAASKRCR